MRTAYAALMMPPIGRRLGTTAASGVAKRTPFECIALVLQGGGILGSYQGGVYQALAEADLHPNWVAGVSIGAVNSALIAGNPPERRVEKLRKFWETVSSPPLGPFGVPYREYLIITYRTNLENGRGGDCIVLGDFRIECTDGTIDHCQPWLVHGVVGVIFPSKDVQP